MSVDVAVIVLTWNEEANLPQALESVCGWANQVFVVDSFSSDRTCEIAHGYGCEVAQNCFENYAAQRNYALSALPVHTEWILFLDADEWLPTALKNEIENLVLSRPRQNGFYISWRMMWMGRWIRRGYYPTWVLRLARYGKVRCESRSVNEHMVVDGLTGFLKSDFIHEDRNGVAQWIAKHNRYASREAAELLKQHAEPGELDARFWGSQAERKRWLRYRVWNHLPTLFRPLLYFFYRYILSGGFLDGRAGFVFHFLQALWYPLLIDIRYLELQERP